CDLEDAVAPDSKDSARELVARLLRDEAGTAEPARPHPKGRGVVPPPTPLSVTSNSSRVSDDSSRDRDASVPIRARSGPARLLRVNGAGTAWFAGDVALPPELELDGLVLPKSSPEAVEALGPGGPPVVAIVETAMGVRQAFEIASH